MKRLGVFFFLCKVFSCGLAEESPCTPGFESELLVFKVHRDHLHNGKRLGRVIFNSCDGRTIIRFQSDDKQFDVNMDGSVTLKRSLSLHEGHKLFSVHAWDFSGKKHTVSVRVECVSHHENMDRVMNISLKSSTGLKRAKRGWVIPPFSITENSRGPFPMKLVQIKSDYDRESQMVYNITGEGADQDPKGIFTVERFSGNLYVTQPLDREKKASYRLIALSTGRDVPNVQEKPIEIVIKVIDQNDNKPVFTHNPFNGHVSESAEKGYEFMTVTATDADDPETESGMVRYKIIRQNPSLPKPNMFDINTVTGGISVKETGMDREQWSTYTLEIVAADMQGKGMEDTGEAVITVTDGSDESPQFGQTMYCIHH